MTDTDPAATVRAAADKLRAHATAATPGQWRAKELPPNEHHKHPAHWVTTEYDDGNVTSSETVADCPWRQADADYIAAVHPAVGLALADLLDDQADGDDEGVINPWALAVARLILEEEPQP
ncbi:MAG TPA: ead/Ea22-like family protein [Streptomyces sp.]|nr:ead/Ea22-like family protein [Streptomyces sp.]